MAKATIPCPHCKAQVTADAGELARCPACDGELRVHEVRAGEQDQAVKRLLSRVKIVERVGERPTRPPNPPIPAKRPWWKFWG